MENRKEYELYMKQVTDAFIDMQSDICTIVGYDRDTGFKSVIWNGGLEYKIELDCNKYIKGVTEQEMKEFNAKIALRYIFENSRTYDEWLDFINK